jgi:integrase
MLASGLLEILMVKLTSPSEAPISDEDLLAACRYWLNCEPWKGLLRDIDEMTPVEIRKSRRSLAKNLVERFAVPHFHEESGEWDDEVGIFDARYDEGSAALQSAGHQNPKVQDCLRATDVIETMVNDRVEARYQSLYEPDAPKSESAADTTQAAQQLLSVAWAEILSTRAEALKKGGKGSRYADKIETAARIFLDLIGDKPLHQYKPTDMQRFVNGLAELPIKVSEKKEFKGLTYKQAIEKNKSLKSSHPTMSETTVRDHRNIISGLWRRVASDIDGVRDLSSYEITMPDSAAAAKDRHPLPPAAISKWLADASHIRLQHMRWMPLIGLLTGMRLAEIVYLQPTDFIEENGLPAVTLWPDLKIGGEEVARELKTKTSKRVVVMPRFLTECGFVAWAKAQPGPFVFAGWHQKAADPAHEASKRMNAWMQQLGIHQKTVHVFHSLRHNNKDWIREHCGERTADIYNGHAVKGVSGKYGAKSLREYEGRKIHEAPLPDGVDFSPFLPATQAPAPSAKQRITSRRKIGRRVTESIS